MARLLFLFRFLLVLACYSPKVNCQDLGVWDTPPGALLVLEDRSSEDLDVGPSHNQTSIAIAPIGIFLNASFESLGLQNEGLVLCAWLTRNQTYEILKKISTFPLSAQAHLTISAQETDQIDRSSFNSFLTTVKELLLTSNFFPQNPLLLQVVTEGKLNCFIGYRVDVIQNHVMIKNVTSHSSVCGLGPGTATVERLTSAASFANDLTGAKLIAAFVQDNETSFDTDVDWEVVDGIPKFNVRGGFAPEILWALGRLLNFSIEAYQSEDWGFYNQEERAWSGSIKHAVEGHVDISVSSAVLTKHRASVVDFNVGTHPITIGIFFKSVRKNVAQFGYSLLAPFRPCLWVAIFVWMLINASIYVFFLKPSGRSKTRPEASKSSLNPLCQRGCNWIPPNFGLRCVYGFQLLTGLVLYSSYAGILVSFLSVEKLAINNLTDLASGKYPFKFGVVGFQLTRQILETCNCSEQERDLVKIFEWVKVPGTTTNEQIDYKDPWGEIRNGTLAFIVDDMTALTEFKKWTPSDACSTQALLFSFSKQIQGTFVKKGSRIKKVIDYGIIRLMENGHVRRFRNTHLPRTISCRQEKSFTGAGVADMKMALQILAGSALLSMIILFLELAYTHLMFNYKLSKILRHGWVN